MEKKDTLDIEFGQNLKNFIPELFARGLIMIFVLLGLNSVGDDPTQHLFFVILFLVFNVVLFLLTLYGTNRRKVSILNFIDMRLKVDEVYGSSQVSYSSNFNNTAFYFYVTLSAMVFLFSLLIFVILRFIPNAEAGSFLIISLIVSVIYGLVLRFYRMNFISKGIVAVTHNGRKFDKEEVTAFMAFLYDEKTESEGYYVNDSLLYDLERNANIYKQRVETLLIEAVFIGALTFGTFIQLTSPESIGSFREIDEIEMNENGLDLDSISRVKHAADFDSLLPHVKNGKLQTASKPKQAPRSNGWKGNANKKKVKKANPFLTAYSTTKNNLTGYIHKLTKVHDTDSLQSQGIFQGWALQRHYNIFSYFYKSIEEKDGGLPYLFRIDPAYDPKDSDDTREEDITALKLSLHALRDTILPKATATLSDSIQRKLIVDANFRALSSDTAQLLIRKIDQQRLIDIFENKRDSIYQLSKDDRAEVLRILYKNDKDKFIKYYCITKDRWDEQEYLFLIAIGSIICSVLYISVLINRFVIILKIETLFSEINKAMAWNRREEDALANEMRAEVENSGALILEKFVAKRKYYTEKLQIQLAKCSQLGTKIETNIQVATFVRNIGLYTFFVVLLVGTMMLDPKFTFVLSFILLYAMVGSAFMQEGSNIRSVWQIFTKNKAD
jgi:hypothetical protein